MSFNIDQIMWLHELRTSAEQTTSEIGKHFTTWLDQTMRYCWNSGLSSEEIAEFVRSQIDSNPDLGVNTRTITTKSNLVRFTDKIGFTWDLEQNQEPPSL